MNEFLIPAMLAYANTVMASRKPDVIIGNADDPYVHRWWIGPHGDEPSAYIHRFFRSDHDGALHDHRYDNVSVILEGSYWEHYHKIPLKITDGKYETLPFLRVPGDIIRRAADTPHRISIDKGPVTTIFFTGAAYRDWGFSTTKGWVYWKTYLDEVGDERPGGNYAETAT